LQKRTLRLSCPAIPVSPNVNFSAAELVRTTCRLLLPARDVVRMLGCAERYVPIRDSQARKLWTTSSLSKSLGCGRVVPSSHEVNRTVWGMDDSAHSVNVVLPIESREMNAADYVACFEDAFLTNDGIDGDLRHRSV
jgi:hypothetical protein